MRIIVFFDLPTVTSSDMREYRKFRKSLIKKGFCMMQESVYSKIALNGTVLNSYVESVKKASPPNGTVQILTVTERQFSSMEYVCGEKTSGVIDSDARLLIL